MSKSRPHRVLSRPELLRRASRHALGAFLILVAGVGIGTVGYRVTAGMDWIDAFLNAAMISSGMGPVDRMNTAAAKLFAAIYALFSGLVFIGVVGIALTPWVHQIFHRIHLEDEE